MVHLGSPGLCSKGSTSLQTSPLQQVSLQRCRINKYITQETPELTRGFQKMLLNHRHTETDKGSFLRDSFKCQKT